MKKRIFNETKIVIASHNKGKIKEITKLLKPLNIEILSAYDLGVDEPIENGNTFEKNALIKSSFVSKKTNLPSLSDDSGICFLDLDGEPGIYSARWAGQNKDFKLAMSKIYEKLKNIQNPTYSCYFTCSLSLCWPDGHHVTVSGSVYGKFSWPPKGKKGFGYDPVFIPLGKKQTFGQMSPEYKHRISHRHKAFKKLNKLCFPNLIM